MEGECGDGTTTSPRSSGVTVVSGSGACWTPTPALHFIDVACGDDFSMCLSNVGTDAGCGSLPGGIVFCWGINTYGQIGDNSTTNKSNSRRVGGAIQGSTVVAIAAGGHTAYALMSGGASMYAWGRNDFGQTGNGNTTSPQKLPVAVNLAALGARVITKISAGSAHSMVLCSDGTVWCWGYNAYGQLGDGTTTNSSTPVAVNLTALGARTVTKISGVGMHSMALCTDGTVWTWGHNPNGELGDGTSGTDRLTPVQVVTGASGCATNLCSITDIGTGNGFPNTSIALKSDGTVWTWGKDDLGMLGTNAIADGANSLSPVQMTGISTANAVAVGGQHTLVALKNGKVMDSGDGLNGEMGDASTTSQSLAVIATTVCTSILPVDILSFNVSYKSGEVNCEWSTASEFNNDYFEVERSVDGKDFVSVGNVKGAGNSSAIKKYSFIDESVYSTGQVMGRSTIFYRLKQVDYDGKYEYFGPVAVLISPSDDWKLLFQTVSYDEQLKGTLLLPERTLASIDILDLQGRVIRHDQINAEKGSNYLSFDVNDISKGAYLIKVSNNENQVLKKFVKL